MAVHRAWVIEAYESAAGVNVAVSELELRGTVGGAHQPGVAAVFSSQFDATVGGSGHAAVNAFDGNANTKTANTNNQFPWRLGVDYGASSSGWVDVAQVAIRSRNDSVFNQAPTFFRVRYSDDLVTWTTAWSASSHNWGQSELRTFVDPGASYPKELSGFILNRWAEGTAGWTSSVGTLNVGNFGGVYQGGFKFFSQGLPNTAGSIHRHYQDVPLDPAYHAHADAGIIVADFTAMLSRGGPDRSRVEVEALTGAGVSLGTIVGPFQPTSAGQFIWLPGAVTITLPPTTRTIRVWMAMENNDGGNTDGYVDGPMTLALYRGDHLYDFKLAASLLVGAYPNRLEAAALRATILSGAYPSRITAAALRVTLLVQPLLRATNPPVQIIGG